MQKRNKVGEKNTVKPSILNSNEMNIEVAKELGLDIQDSNLTGRMSKEAYDRTEKAKKKSRK